jgi:hypothetical protein
MAKRVLGVGTAALFFVMVVGPAKADGLGRFEQVIKPKIPAGALTYKSAKALGDNGFVLEDVVVTPPDKAPRSKAEPVQIKRISVEELDFAAFEKQMSPNFAKIKAEGIAITGKPAEGVDLKELAGVDSISADLSVDYRLDPDQHTMTLNRLELSMNGVARLELSMILDGVSTDMAANPGAAMDKATLRSAVLTYDDQSLLGKVMPIVAGMQGTDPASMIKLATTTLDAVRTGQAPGTQAAIDAMGSYLEDYQKPKGPLKVTLNPPNKVSATAISNAKSPDEVVKALGLVVSYAGTRAGGSGASGGSASPAGATPSCTSGARFFVLHEEVWWAATARDASKSGKDCIARIEGSDEDIVVPMDKTLAWSIDGPGKAVDKCQSGVKILVLDKDDGGWYSGKVADKPFGDDQCAVKYDNPDNDDETVPVKRVRRLD